jgi:hypothetical protein
MPLPFQDKIDRVERLITANSAVLVVDQNRYQANRKRAFVATNQRNHARHLADRERAHSHIRKAAHYDDVASRKSVVIQKNHARAEHFLAEIKRRQRVAHDLDERHDLLAKHAKEYLETHGLHIVGNKVIGEGSNFDKWVAAGQAAVANCAHGKSRNFYSMTGGGFPVQHCILGGAQHGERYDCSVFVTGLAWSCGFDDPNGEDFHAGYTGTLIGAHGRWKEVSLQHMLDARQPGYIVYGSGVGHHTEAWCPKIGSDGKYIDALRTAGHGSAPVDYGTVHLFGSGEVERYFIYVT